MFLTINLQYAQKHARMHTVDGETQVFLLQSIENGNENVAQFSALLFYIGPHIQPLPHYALLHENR